MGNDLIERNQEMIYLSIIESYIYEKTNFPLILLVFFSQILFLFRMLNLLDIVRILMLGIEN